MYLYHKMFWKYAYVFTAPAHRKEQNKLILVLARIGLFFAADVDSVKK